jgi:hypothetical protein
MVIVEKLVECRLAGETEVLGENLPHRHFVYHKSHMIRTRFFNPGRRGGKPATNRLSYGAAPEEANCRSDVQRNSQSPTDLDNLLLRAQGFATEIYHEPDEPSIPFYTSMMKTLEISGRNLLTIVLYLHPFFLLCPLPSILFVYPIGIPFSPILLPFFMLKEFFDPTYYLPLSVSCSTVVFHIAETIIFTLLERFYRSS